MRLHIRMNRSGSTVALAAAASAALLLAGCSSGKPSGGSGSGTPSSSAPSSAAAPSSSASASGGSGGSGPTISISPSGTLTSGQKVHVTGSGFSPNEPLVVNECADKGASTGPGDCDLTAMVATKSDGSGNVSADYTVTKGPFGTNKIVCGADTKCLLSVSQASANPTDEADVPLTFG